MGVGWLVCRSQRPWAPRWDRSGNGRRFSAPHDLRQREAVLLRLEPVERLETGGLLASRDVVLG
jgi:hypothetical protein